VPQRRCVGCGKVRPKTELLRLTVAGDGARRRAVLDHDGRLPGRGAYLCRALDAGSIARLVAERACLERATHRGAIARALRCAVKLDSELVESQQVSPRPDADR
jgi:uncharacterized protein